MTRFYAKMLIEKAFDEGDERIIEGMASTSDIDRMGDIVEAEGAKFDLPLPLLWQHNHDQPVGVVERATVAKKGVKFRARLANVDGPPGLKNRIDEAWASVKAGLIHAVSIGFRGIESALMETGGIKFLKWEWVELSLVTVPANPNASIDSIRAYHEERGMSAANARRMVAITPADVPARTKTSAKGNKDMNIAEQIKALEDDIRRKATKMTEIQTKAIDAGRNKTNDEKDEFDRLNDEIKALKEELEDLKTLEAANATVAAPVEPAAQKKAAATAPDAGQRIVVNNKRAEPGIGLAQALMCRAIAKLEGGSSAELAKEHYSYDPRIEMLCKSMFTKAAVAGAVTTAPAWAGVLADPQDLVSEFVEWMFPTTIVGKLTKVKKVDFNYEIPRQTGKSTAAWTKDGGATPVSALAFDKVTIGRTALSAMCYTSKRNLRFAHRNAETIFRDDLAKDIRRLLDSDFVDPTNAGTANVKPASITDGLTPIAPSGTDVDAVNTDIASLVRTIVAANLSISGVSLIMNEDMALSIGLLTNALGQHAFPELGPSGGMLLKMPVIASNSVGNGDIIAVHEPSIYLATDDDVSIDFSGEASIQADDAPTQDASTGTGTTSVSMFQTRSVAFLAEMYANWVVARTGAVAMIGVGAYNGAVSA